MRKTKTRLWSFVVAVILAMVLIFQLPSCLTLNRKTPKASVLVVEGWIPYIALDIAYDEFKKGFYDKIVITGSTITDDITLYINSFLVVYPAFESENEEILNIRLNVKSSLGFQDSAHFVLWINNHHVGSFYTPQNQGEFFVEVPVQGKLDSLMIQYTNDTFGKMGDRNLQVKSLFLNGNNLLDNTTPRFIDRGRPFGQYRWNIKESSYAEFAANYFKDREIDHDMIVPVTNYLEGKRRTYGNALALRQWFDENEYYPQAINIVSMNYHSRRTWMIYNQLLGDKMEVGIISVKSVQRELTWYSRIYYILREFLALIYYLIFIMPWV
jgi:hypothetical protein